MQIDSKNGAPVLKLGECDPAGLRYRVAVMGAGGRHAGQRKTHQP
jgi:hypothetical protein